MAARFVVSNAWYEPLKLFYNNSRINLRGSKRPGSEISEGEPVAGPSSQHIAAPERPSKKCKLTAVLPEVVLTPLFQRNRLKGDSAHCATN